MTITHTLARTDTPWHRLDVRHWDALAHTSVSVLGILDTQAVEAIDDAVRTADFQRHTVSVELQQISSVTPEALEALLAPHPGRPVQDRFCGMQARLACAERIRHALDEDRFVLYWQPIIDLATDTATHHEVLLRMIGIDGEVIAPVEFIETAEQFGLIGELDRWVVRAAIQQLAADEDGVYRLELNLSGRSIGDPELPELIEREIAAAGVDPGRLVFEITETAAIANMAHARVFAERLRRLGCRLALDDFGAGFSSFYYLKHLPLGLHQDRRRLHPQPRRQRHRPAGRQVDRRHRPRHGHEDRRRVRRERRDRRRCCAGKASTTPRASTTDARSPCRGARLTRRRWCRRRSARRGVSPEDRSRAWCARSIGARASSTGPAGAWRR